MKDILYYIARMKLSDYPILCINLADRKDRWEYMEKQFISLGIRKNVYRFEAMDGRKLDETDLQDMKRQFRILPTVRPERLIGRIGCYLSHMAALRYALEQGWTRVLILEDDCAWFEGADGHEFEVPHDTDVFYLGGLFWRQKPEPQLQTGKWVHIQRNHLKVACCLAYGFQTREAMERVYDTLMSAPPSTIDLMYINHIQKLGHCYILNPVLCRQNHTFTSDVSSIGGPPPRFVKKPDAYCYTVQKNERLLLSR